MPRVGGALQRADSGVAREVAGFAGRFASLSGTSPPGPIAEAGGGIATGLVSELLMGVANPAYGARHAASATRALSFGGEAIVAFAILRKPSDVMPGEIFREPTR